MKKKVFGYYNQELNFMFFLNYVFAFLSFYKFNVHFLCLVDNERLLIICMFISPSIRTPYWEETMPLNMTSNDDNY